MISASVMASINRTCEASVSYGAPPVELVPSGFPQLDAAIGGIPRGRIIEIHGGEGSGKTALALHLAQQLGGPVLYIDADHGLSPYILGGQELYLLDVPSLEDALDACRIAAAGGFATIVLDTVAALPTKADLQDGVAVLHPTTKWSQASVMSKALRCFVGLLHETGCTLILVNQIRNKHGIFYGSPYYPTGGKAIGYFSALRLETLRIEQIKLADEAIGQVMRVDVRKCKYGPLGMRTAIQLFYGRGVSA